MAKERYVNVAELEYMLEKQMSEFNLDTNRQFRKGYKKACEIIKDCIVDYIPELEPVKRGKWKYEQLDKFRKYKVTCSECGWQAVGNYDAYVEPEDFIYCPQCGAKMDAE